MSLRETREEIANIKKRISSIKESQKFALQQLRKLEERLNFLTIKENCLEEHYAGIL